MSEIDFYLVRYRSYKGLTPDAKAVIFGFAAMR